MVQALASIRIANPTVGRVNPGAQDHRIRNHQPEVSFSEIQGADTGSLPNRSITVTELEVAPGHHVARQPGERTAALDPTPCLPSTKHWARLIQRRGLIAGEVVQRASPGLGRSRRNEWEVRWSDQDRGWQRSGIGVVLSSVVDDDAGVKPWHIHDPREE